MTGELRPDDYRGPSSTRVLAAGRWRRRTRAPSLARVFALILLAATGRAAAWSYAIGEAQPGRQVNLCETQTDAEEVAWVFNRFGPRPGYAALSHAPGCALGVHRVKPLRVLTEVVVSEGQSGEYRVRFLEVEIENGDRRYLVTTRDVANR